MNGEPIRPVPKPQKRGKESASPLRAKGWGVKPGPHPSKYRRREREYGRMLFIRSTLSCAAILHPDAGPCRGRVECAHLGPSANGQKCPDHECGALCTGHHGMVDNPAGWYLDLSRDERWVFRWAAINAAKQAWSDLTDEQRAYWDDRAALSRATGGAAS